MRGSNRLRDLERAYRGRREQLEQAAENEEFNYLFNKHHDLEEYDEMHLRVEDLLTAFDEHGEDSEETLKVNERAAEAYQRWLNRARELEREETDGR